MPNNKARHRAASALARASTRTALAQAARWKLRKTPPPPDEWEQRGLSLNNQNNLSGSTGDLHTTYAQSGAAGTFRVGFLFDWFTSKGFLCDPGQFTAANQAVTCSGTNKEDSASQVGGYFTLSATPFSFLEAYASLRTYANSNDQGSPQLLQVLGDTTFGVKGFTPPRLLGPVSVGLDAELLLLNGTGDVGLSGSSTSARFTALGTVDFRNLKKTGKGGFPAPRQRQPRLQGRQLGQGRRRRREAARRRLQRWSRDTAHHPHRALRPRHQ